MSEQNTSPDAFDRIFGSLEGLPGVLATAQATVLSSSPLIGNVETYIVQTVRHPETGDTIFVQWIGGDRSLRLVIPPKVSATIARQYVALSKRARVRAARQAVATKRERGISIGNPTALAKARRRKRTK